MSQKLEHCGSGLHKASEYETEIWKVWQAHDILPLKIQTLNTNLSGFQSSPVLGCPEIRRLLYYPLK